MVDGRRPRQVVLLIRGLPGVGKTYLAYELAKSLNYCLVCKDDVREAALRHDAQVIADIREKIPDKYADEIRVDSNEMTYEAMFAVGLTQLRVGAKGIVLESPLGRVALGERAVEITKEAQALCVLVDCYADRSVWEQRLQQRAVEKDNSSKDYFKPSNPVEIERHYSNIQYKIDCDAHVRIDCGLPAEHNVKTIDRIIKHLLSEES